MKFFCRVTPEGLVPLDDNDAVKKAKLRLGSDVSVDAKCERNSAFHRKFFALLTLTAGNLPEKIAETLHITNVDTLLEAIKIDLGYYDVIEINGRSVLKLRSISFAKMDEKAFEEFYNKAVAHILNNYLLPGTCRDDLLQEVEYFISNPIKKTDK